jgi:hypothetical protein
METVMACFKALFYNPARETRGNRCLADKDSKSYSPEHRVIALTTTPLHSVDNTKKVHCRHLPETWSLDKNNFEWLV